MSQRIDSLIRAVVAHTGKQQAVLFDIQRSWIALVGEGLAAHSRPVRLSKGRLWIHVDHPGDGFEMSYRAPAIVKRLRQQTEGKVEEVVIRTGRLPAGSRS